MRMQRIVVFGNGFQTEEDEIMGIAEKIAKKIMSELPEEIQTYDGAVYMLRMTKEKIKTMKIHYKE